jgi:hypothetical protein
MSAEAMRAKFAECARHARAALRPGGAEAIATAIDRLDTVESVAGLLP